MMWLATTLHRPCCRQGHRVRCQGGAVWWVGQWTALSTLSVGAQTLSALPSNLSLHTVASCRPEMVVGWYHSHPGFGCWLSGVDINTQQVRTAGSRVCIGEAAGCRNRCVSGGSTAGSVHDSNGM